MRRKGVKNELRDIGWHSDQHRHYSPAEGIAVIEVHDGILRAPEGSALVVSRPAMEVVDAGKQAKRSRKKIVDNIDRAVLKLLREMHKRLAALERSQQTFAEWRDDVLGKFVNDGD
jgi:hypothetical protein